MSANTNPNVVTGNLITLFDSVDDQSYANSGVIPPKSESISSAWKDYNSQQANYTVVGDDGVIIHSSYNNYCGYFQKIFSTTGYWTMAFEYQSDTGATFTIDNNGIQDNDYNASMTATTTKQVHTKTVNVTSTSAYNLDMYIHRNSGGNITISNYRFYKSDSSGNSLVWHDLCGLQSVDAFYGDPSYDPNTALGTFDLDGTDDFFRVPNQTTHVTAKTWGIWFKLNSIPASSTFDSIFQKSANWNVATGISLQMIYGYLRWSWGENWGGSAYVSLSTLSTGTWYYVVGSCDGSTTRLYINGDLKDTGTAAVTPSDTSPVYIGYGSGGSINGSVSRFEIYSDELSATEILQNYNAHKARFGL